MAAILSEEENQHLPVVGDESCNLAVAGSCFELLNPSFDEVNPHCSLDVVPILLEGASLPREENCGFHSSPEQDVCSSIAMLSSDGNSIPQCTTQLAFLSFVELPVPQKNQMCLDSQLNCQKFIDSQLESGVSYSPCIVDVDIEMQDIEKTKSNDNAIGCIESEGIPTMVLHRQTSFKNCGRFMQLLRYPGSTLLKLISREKSFTERVHDTPNYRWRKYKRTASFDSRQIVLLFSILSSLGTLVLIYLTLRVRQSVDGLANA